MDGGRPLVWCLVVWWAVGDAVADEDGPVPQTPTAFETEEEGGGSRGGARIREKEVKAKKRTYTAVTESRDWKDAKGVVIRARLLAFETGKVIADGQAATLIRDGRVRMLVEGRKQVSEFPITRLTATDQAFIMKLAAAERKKAADQNSASRPKLK